MKNSTQILHSNLNINSNSIDNSPLHTAIQPSITYHYDSAEHLIEVFQGKRKGFTYARQSSPTILALEEKVNQLEQGRGTLVFSTGMAAISDTFIALLKQGDHIVTSHHLFGNTLSFFKILERLGFDVSYIDCTDAQTVARAIKSTTRFFFTETISNPLTLIPDLTAISELLKQKKIFSIIDNTITTPFIFKPTDMGFSFSMNSLSKYLGGNGNSLAGSITDLGNYDGANDDHILPQYKKLDIDNCLMLQLKKKALRDQGATLSPYNAFQVSQGMDTASLRLKQHAKNTALITEYLSQHPKVAIVNHPLLSSHPQHQRAQKLFGSDNQDSQQYLGGILSFILKSDLDSHSPIQAIKLLNHFRIILRSTHLGDARTMSIPIAPTIFNEHGVDGRKKIGIDEGLIRLSIGIEEPDDLLEDLEQALEKI